MAVGEAIGWVDGQTRRAGWGGGRSAGRPILDLSSPRAIEPSIPRFHELSSPLDPSSPRTFEAPRALEPLIPRSLDPLTLHFSICRALEPARPRAPLVGPAPVPLADQEAVLELIESGCQDVFEDLNEAYTGAGDAGDASDLALEEYLSTLIEAERKEVGEMEMEAFEDSGSPFFPPTPALLPPSAPRSACCCCATGQAAAGCRRPGADRGGPLAGGSGGSGSLRRGAPRAARACLPACPSAFP